MEFLTKLDTTERCTVSGCRWSGETVFIISDTNFQEHG